MHLKTASDVLTNPTQRFAYERFGPEILAWRHCVSLRDYVWRGLQTQVLMHYGLAAAGLYGLGFLGYFELGRYWRWVTLVGLCVFEAHTVMRPRFPAFVETVVNPFLVRFTSHAPYLPFQVVALARRVAIANLHRDRPARPRAPRRPRPGGRRRREGAAAEPGAPGNILPSSWMPTPHASWSLRWRRSRAIPTS